MAKIIVSVIFLALAWPATAGEPPAMIDLVKKLSIQQVEHPPDRVISIADVDVVPATEEWDGSFDDRWHSSAAFKGPFLAEFHDGLVAYLEAKGFRVKPGNAGDVVLKVVLSGFEGRKRVHNDGGDLRGAAVLVSHGKTLSTKPLFESLSYRDQSDERPKFEKEFGLQVRFDTIIFFRLSVGLFSRVAAFLEENREALNSVPNPPFASGNVEKTSAQGEGLLTLESVPAGAEIYLDGNLIATTPAVKVSISAGRHVVLLRKRGFQDWRREVSVLAGNTLTLRAELEATGNEHK